MYVFETYFWNNGGKITKLAESLKATSIFSFTVVIQVSQGLAISLFLIRSLDKIVFLYIRKNCVCNLFKYLVNIADEIIIENN